MTNVATHSTAPAYVLEFSSPAWSVCATSTTGQYYTVECIPSLDLVGADYWEGSTIQGHALAAAIMLAQLKQSGLALRGAAATELLAQAGTLPADMPRFWE